MENRLPTRRYTEVIPEKAVEGYRAYLGIGWFAEGGEVLLRQRGLLQEGLRSMGERRATTQAGAETSPGPHAV